ncbi:MAG: hypothetical protein ACE5KM_01910 [Planctomycetaceae bacterium]
MQKQIGNSRALWLGAGLIAGLCIAYFWPHEPVAAASNDRASKFGMMTTSMGLDVEGVFVLDYLTGRLTGAVMNTRTGKFGVVYTRVVAADFGVNPKTKPQYAFVGGVAALSGRGATPANSVIYVGELTSGKVIAYAMKYTIPRGVVPRPQPLIPRDFFPFRQAAPKE